MLSPFGGGGSGPVCWQGEVIHPKCSISMGKRFPSKVLNKFNPAFWIIMENADSSNLWHYNKVLRDYANKNRKEMTRAEACLWKYALSKGQMEGYQFLRQSPVLNYIADFMCKELMLIIEVDGLTHQW
jgi:hypothetical protein